MSQSYTYKTGYFSQQQESKRLASKNGSLLGIAGELRCMFLEG